MAAYPDDDPLLARRRRQRRSRARRRLVGLSALVLALLVGVGVALARYARQPGSPLARVAPGLAADGWTHAELHGELGRVGVKCRMAEGSPGRSVFLVFDDDPDGLENAVFLYRHNNFHDTTLVVCEKEADPESARELAGTNPARTWAWGRWVFRCGRGGEANLDVIAKALSGKSRR